MTTTLGESGLGSGNRVKRLKLLLYGPFGGWKTVNAHRLPNARTLDLDDGMQSVEWAVRAGKIVHPGWENLSIEERLHQIVYHTINPPASMDESKNRVFEEANSKIDEWAAEEDIDPADWDAHCLQAHGIVYKQMWDTLIIDSGSSLAAGTIIKGIREMDRLGLSESWKKKRTIGLTPRMIQDYGASAILFEKFMRMCYGLGKNLVLVCHEYHDTDKKGVLIEDGVQPALPGALRKSLPKDFDEVWYSRIKGTADKPVGQFQTQRDPYHRCRSRLGCLDGREDADFDLIKAKVAKFYGIDKDKLWLPVHGTGAAAALREEEANEAVMA